MIARKSNRNSLNRVASFSIGVFSLFISVGQMCAADIDKAVAFDIQHQPLDSALLMLSDQAKIQVIVDADLLVGYQSKGISGSMPVASALSELLSGTDLAFETSGNTVTVTRATINVDGQENSDKRKVLDSNRETIEEITVTAQKREQSLYEVPMSIVAIGSAEIKSRGITDMEELGMAVPGISVHGDGGASGRQIYIRGIGNQAGNDVTTLIGYYLDEVPMISNRIWHLDARMYDLQRVEVLRGPQGTLYGQGSAGGTIRFITNDPKLDQFEFNADVSSMFTKGGDPSQNIDSVINIPLIEDELAVRVTTGFSHAGGWIDQPAAGRDDINDESLTEVRIKTLWQPTEALQVNAMVNIHDNERGKSNAAEDENGNYTQVFGQLMSPNAEEGFEIYNLTVTYDFDNITLLSTTSYIHADMANINDGVTIFGAFQDLPHQFVDTDALTQEIRFSSRGNGPLQWTMGVYYSDLDSFRKQKENFGVIGLTSIPPAEFGVTLQQSKNWAVFGDVSYNFTDRLQVGAGLRKFEDNQTYYSFVENSPATTSTRSEGTFDALSPRVYASFDLQDNVKVYSSIAKGFRSGGFNAFQAGVELPPTYGPETVWTYEVGMKSSLFTDKLDLELAVYHSDYEDYQLFTFVVPPPGSFTGNSGEIGIDGMDVGFTVEATDSWTLFANVSYTKGEYTEIAPGGSRSVGQKVENIPEYQVALSSVYDFDWLERPGFFRIDYSKRGEATNHVTNPPPLSDVIDMLNMRLEWDWSTTLTFGVFAANLLNDRGFTNGAWPLELAPRPRPRTFGINARIAF